VAGCWQYSWRRAGREGVALDRVSPALRAWASDFSLRCQRKVTKRKATPANPLASPVPSGQSYARPDPIWPLSDAATPSSLMASLTLLLPLGGLERDQYCARL